MAHTMVCPSLSLGVPYLFSKSYEHIIVKQLCSKQIRYIDIKKTL